MGERCALTFADRLEISTGSKTDGTVRLVNPHDACAHAEQRTFLDWLGPPAGDDELTHATCAVLVAPGSPALRRLASSSQFHSVAQNRRAELWGRSACESSR